MIKYEGFVKNCLIDYISAIVGGAAVWGKKISDMVDTFSEKGIYEILGQSQKVTITTALLCNGILSHVAELDDGVISGIIHPGAPIFTALLVYAKTHSVEWTSFVRGVVIGYEASCRIAEAIQPSHKRMGYHASATCGTVGVALGLLAMVGGDRVVMKEALALSLASSHGTLKVLEDNSELKPYNIGTAALNGYIAFMMALSGFKGAEDPFVGEAGFLRQMSNSVNEDMLVNGQTRLSIERVYFKPYASCRYTHPGIEAAIRLRNMHKFELNEIEGIEIKTYKLAIPHHDHVDVSNLSSAKMSIPYGAVIGLVIGDGGVKSYTDDKINDPIIKKLINKVCVKENVEYTRNFPQKSAASVRIKLFSGEEYLEEVNCPKGESDNPMTEADLVGKLKSSCEFCGLDFKTVSSLIESLYDGRLAVGSLIAGINNMF